jgi:hypothetical protein
LPTCSISWAETAKEAIKLSNYTINYHIMVESDSKDLENAAAATAVAGGVLVVETEPHTGRSRWITIKKTLEVFAQQTGFVLCCS